MIDLAAIRARLAAATPGPWFAHPNDLIGGHAVMHEDRPPIESNAYVADFTRREDADLIAHAPTDIAILLAEVERLRADVDSWEDAAALACECPDGECDCPGCSRARDLA